MDINSEKFLRLIENYEKDRWENFEKGFSRFFSILKRAWRKYDNVRNEFNRLFERDIKWLTGYETSIFHEKGLKISKESEDIIEYAELEDLLFFLKSHSSKLQSRIDFGRIAFFMFGIILFLVGEVTGKIIAFLMMGIFIGLIVQESTNLNERKAIYNELQLLIEKRLHMSPKTAQMNKF
ncbi:MAG: hypothetical protein HY096_01655 [Nitrospinae bacterium]|nr:hypothetical protein [Nitrospinota bacterium]